MTLFGEVVVVIGVVVIYWELTSLVKTVGRMSSHLYNIERTYKQHYHHLVQGGQ